LYGNNQTVIDYPRNEAFFTTNDVAGNNNALQAHIASIITIRPKIVGDRGGRMSVE